MNEFTAKKLGEVLAFIRLVEDTLQQGSAGFASAKTTDKVAVYLQTTADLQAKITGVMDASDKAEVTLAKAERTLTKVAKARDDYIDGRWDDPVELYEWLSFNAGAGTAHASEVEGAAASLADQQLQIANQEAMTFFDGLLLDCKHYLNQVGRERALL